MFYPISVLPDEIQFQPPNVEIDEESAVMNRLFDKLNQMRVKRSNLRQKRQQYIGYRFPYYISPGPPKTERPFKVTANT